MVVFCRWGLVHEKVLRSLRLLLLVLASSLSWAAPTGSSVERSWLDVGGGSGTELGGVRDGGALAWERVG